MDQDNADQQQQHIQNPAPGTDLDLNITAPLEVDTPAGLPDLNDNPADGENQSVTIISSPLTKKEKKKAKRIEERRRKMDMEIRQVQLEAQRRKAKGKTQEQNEEESESEDEEGGSKFWRTSMGGHKDGGSTRRAKARRNCGELEC
ncbi:hypothetical protein R1sor_013855 [Riccia sorocarpa]|uniref:Uncharacterized protein n=1 Tax=Riccia sorocarpa TaxID=122646 RepID=A0ABD3H9M9_9MARC